MVGDESLYCQLDVEVHPVFDRQQHLGITVGALLTTLGEASNSEVGKHCHEDCQGLARNKDDDSGHMSII